MPRSRTIRRAGPRVSRRSSIACPVDSQMPLTTSTVLRSNSLCTRGFSPISAMTAVASWLRSRVRASTSANSHSTPMVGRGERAKSMRAFALLTGELAGTNDTARHPLTGVAGAHRHAVGARRPVGLVVALRRNVGEVVGTGMDDDRGLLAAEQVLHGEGVGGGHQRAAAVSADLQRGQVTAGRLRRVPGDLEVIAGGQEVAGCAAVGPDRIGLTLADLVDVDAVEPGRELAGAGGGDGDGGIAVAELARRGRDLGAVRRLDVSGDLLRRGRLTRSGCGCALVASAA